MSDKKLLPCPFCGGEAEMVHNMNVNWFVKCKHCFCRTPSNTTETFARVRWNTRKPMERIVERLEESKGTHIDEHGKELYQEDYFIDIDDAINIVKEEGGLNEI